MLAALLRAIHLQKKPVAEFEYNDGPFKASKKIFLIVMY